MSFYAPLQKALATRAIGQFYWRTLACKTGITRHHHQRCLYKPEQSGPSRWLRSAPPFVPPHVISTLTDVRRFCMIEMLVVIQQLEHTFGQFRNGQNQDVLRDQPPDGRAIFHPLLQRLLHPVLSILSDRYQNNSKVPALVARALLR
jgi:hypothetical protein